MDRKKWEDARDALSAVMGLNIYDLYYDTQNPEKLYSFSILRIIVSLIVAAICIGAAIFNLV